MNFSQTKKIIIFSLLISLIPAPVQAWSFSDVTNFIKKTGQSVAVIAAAFVSVAAVAALINYCLKPKPQAYGNSKHVHTSNPAHNTHTSYQGLLSELNTLLQEINSQRRIQNPQPYVDRLYSISAQLFNVKLRCDRNLFDTLDKRYKHIVNEAHFKNSIITELYTYCLKY